jgi:hypothetical protein
VHGQIAEAAVLGIGGAPLEEFVYDEAGQPLATEDCLPIGPSKLHAMVRQYPPKRS